MQIWIIAKYEVIRMMRMKYVMAIQFAMPLLLIFILGSALSGAFKVEDRTIQPVKVDLVQGDSGVLKSAFESFLSAPQVSQMINTTEVRSRDEAVNRLQTGESEFALVIPANFSSQVISGQEAAWEMILGNQYEQNLTAQLVLRSFIDNVNRKQAASMTSSPEAQQLIQSEASPASGSHVRLGKLASTNSNYTAMQYYAASMLVMFLLYSGLSTAMTLHGERENHTLSRLNAMPMQPYNILLGKVLGNAFIAGCQAAIIVTATVLFYDVDWGASYPLLALVCFSVIIASMCLAVLIATYARSSKAISTIFQMLILVMSFLSGGFTPLPEGLLSRLGDFTLNYWAMQSMLRIMLGSNMAVLIQHLSVMGWISAGLLLVTIAVYRKAGYHE
ncbi:ABC transporter permease [Paenibacillus sp. GCM10023248]|uniref:ABC transporter permease n=1 Tax=unclassified Paenibacillus TaxID=185978 RepID=UPI002378DFB1|nr:ABC transporter permease [Paenibacillus sp. MAHUQ-63]MDD9270116.1 ABC transporter permease [Paenibacillus sp. MAHUQ-63]